MKKVFICLLESWSGARCPDVCRKAVPSCGVSNTERSLAKLQWCWCLGGTSRAFSSADRRLESLVDSPMTGCSSSARRRSNSKQWQRCWDAAAADAAAGKRLVDGAARRRTRRWLPAHHRAGRQQDGGLLSQSVALNDHHQVRCQRHLLLTKSFAILLLRTTRKCLWYGCSYRLYLFSSSIAVRAKSIRAYQLKLMLTLSLTLTVAQALTLLTLLLCFFIQCIGISAAVGRLAYWRHCPYYRQWSVGR